MATVSLTLVEIKAVVFKYEAAVYRQLHNVHIKCIPDYSSICDLEGMQITIVSGL